MKVNRSAVVIPGIMGSSLKYTNGGVVWDEDFLLNYKTLLENPAVLKWTGTRAQGTLIERVRVSRLVPFFRLSLWEKTCNKLHEQDFAVHKYGYDWRDDLTKSATELALWLNSIPRPWSFVCHSMGGLLVRVAMGNGDITLNNVDRIVRVGSPMLGAPIAFLSMCAKPSLPLFTEVRDMAFPWDRAEYDRLLRDVLCSFPSVYQLLPHRGFNYVDLSPLNSVNPLDHNVLTLQQRKWADDASLALRKASEKLAQTNKAISIYTSHHSNAKTPIRFSAQVVENPDRHYEFLGLGSETKNGDGTVPSDSARGPETELSQSVKDATHSWMCASRRVARLIVDALANPRADR